MAGMHQHGPTQARFFERLNSGALETDAVISFQHRLLVPTIAACDAAVPLAYSGRNMCNFVTTRFAGMSRPAECIQRPKKERAHEIRLESARLSPLHFFFHSEDALRAHGFLSQGVPVEQRLQMVTVQCLVDFLCKAGPHLGLITVADGLDEQILEARFLEDFTQYVEDAAFQSLAFNFYFLEQPMIDIAFTSFFGYKVPQMADLSLADAVDASEPLL